MRLWLSSIVFLIFLSCSGEPVSEPVVSDPAFVGIDPDRKAMPKDGTTGAAETTTDASASVVEQDIAQASPSENSSVDSAAQSPAPTPPVEEISQSLDAGISPSDSQSSVDSGSSEGSGPQVRYIKAFEINIRSKPNRHSKIVGRLKGGTLVKVSIHGGWSKLDDGRWIRTRWLVKSPPDRLTNIPPDQEGRPMKSKRGRQNKKSKRSSRGSKS